MALAIEQSEVIKSMQAALVTAVPVRQTPQGPAIENKPLVGPEVTIRLSLSPGMITLIAAPAAVLATMVVGWLALRTSGLPIHAGEMVAGGVVNTLGGIAASLPLFILMKRGATVIAQAGILGIALRVGTVLMGMLMAGATAWGLDRMILVYWVMAYYFPLLMVETAVVAWLANKAKH